jgi:hypothetical protein
VLRLKAGVITQSPSGTSSPSALPPGGAGVFVCTLPSLDNGASVTETLRGNVTAAPGKKILDTASVSSLTFDPNETNNSAKTTTRVM